jgi:hypothetical protein
MSDVLWKTSYPGPLTQNRNQPLPRLLQPHPYRDPLSQGQQASWSLRGKLPALSSKARAMPGLKPGLPPPTPATVNPTLGWLLQTSLHLSLPHPQH